MSYSTLGGLSPLTQDGVVINRGDLAAGSDLTAQATGNTYLDGDTAVVNGDRFRITGDGVLTVSDGTVDVTDGDFILIRADRDDTAITVADVEVNADTGGSPVSVMVEQSADFTATAGSNGECHEWPVNVSGLAAGGVINVAEPAGPHEPGDSFAIFDSRLATDNGITAPALNRRIRINFTSNLHSLPGPDYAEINSAGARIKFTYIDATIGWSVAANVNT